MWRTKGQGELYTYLPSPENTGFDANRKLCDVAPKSDCNPTYGASVGRGAFDFKSGQWNTVSQRVRLNDVGQSNGELELFFNGESVINVKGLKFRNSAQGRFRGLQAQTFFGGKLPRDPLFCGVHVSSLLSSQARSLNSLHRNPRTLGSPTSPSPSSRPSERLNSDSRVTITSHDPPSFLSVPCGALLHMHAFITPLPIIALHLTRFPLFSVSDPMILLLWHT